MLQKRQNVYRGSSIFILNMRCISSFYFLDRKEKDKIIAKINAKKYNLYLFFIQVVIWSLTVRVNINLGYLRTEC
jgi:hypothetical protein